ncbi:MAG: preprotein translocase subunit SecY [Nanobdellota archaeon]
MKMSMFDSILNNLPEVVSPTQKKLGFKEKVKWTLIVLVLFFILGLIPLFGLGQNALQQFEFLSVVLGAQFGSIISLGIGPIVTASIVLQLLNGSGLVKFDLESAEGKKRFQGIQKLLALGFIIFEAAIYVFMGGLAPAQSLKGTPLFFNLELLLVFQLILGGILIMFMDEVISKWGFGSGISLFIAAGVSKTIFVRAFSWMPGPNATGTGYSYATGAFPALFQALGQGDPTTATLKIAAIIATIVVIVMSVYSQAMKVEIPLSFGRVRGHGIRWPLKFMYTSNIPVILVAALMANMKMWSQLFDAQNLVKWITVPGGRQGLVGEFIKGTSTWTHAGQATGYFLLMMVGCVVFAWFWMQTAGMDPKSQAKKIMSSGLQVPGFRKDPRVLERILGRYIGPLTIMGGITVGVLAAIADLAGALANGTGILLTVMIIYNLYEEIAKHHMMDMNPMMRKFME